MTRGVKTTEDALTGNRRFYSACCESYTLAAKARDKAVLRATFAGLLPRRARILDAGCGPGTDAAAFTRMGFRVAAFDATREMVSTARAIGVDAKLGTFESFKSSARFDGVWASASLIHVPRERIRRVLLRLFRVLRPGGMLYVSLWEGFGQGTTPDGRFISRYYSSEFRAMLESIAGIRIVAAFRLSGTNIGNGAIRIGFIARKGPQFLPLAAPTAGSEMQRHPRPNRRDRRRGSPFSNPGRAYHGLRLV